MDDRKLDLGMELTRDEWEILGRAASEMTPADGGYDWEEARPDAIRVYARPGDAPAGWSERLLPDQQDRPQQELARLHFNGGRPAASLEPLSGPEGAPALRDSERRGELESWVRDRWRHLLESSPVDPGSTGA